MKHVIVKGNVQATSHVTDDIRVIADFRVTMSAVNSESSIEVTSKFVEWVGHSKRVQRPPYSKLNPCWWIKID